VRIVITGASGNVGTALLLRLGRSGEHELVGLSRREPPRVAPYSWADWVSTDIGHADATDTLTEVFAGADVVIHLAWLIQPARDRELMRRANQDGTAAVAKAAIVAGVAHLVHQSSVGAYSPGAGKTVDESWPTEGISTSSYSVDKAAAEAIVSQAEDELVVTRVRPGLIFQEAAASEVIRYFLGPLVPSAVLRRSLLRFAPFPDALAFQLVHADDVATAIELIVRERAAGAFNVAAYPVIDREVFQRVFGGVGPSVPPSLLRALASATWRARLQPTEPGWLDLAAQVPFLKTDRLAGLGWAPAHDAEDVLGRFVDALNRGAGRPGPLLARRSGERPGPSAGSEASAAQTDERSP
jgi:UDP-glucose 4-epimerase